MSTSRLVLRNTLVIGLSLSAIGVAGCRRSLPLSPPVAAAPASSGSPAGIGNEIQMKPGLWLIQTDTGDPKASKIGIEPCIGPAPAQPQPPASASPSAAPACKLVHGVDRDGVRTDTVDCAGDTDLHLVYRYVSPEHIVILITGQAKPESEPGKEAQPKTPVSIRQDLTYIGECPGKMRAGQMMMPDGTIIDSEDIGSFITWMAVQPPASTASGDR